MVESDRFESFMVEPPCTSFSAAAHPVVRRYSNQYGFDLTEAKTFHGNQLAYRSFILLKVGCRKKKPCGLEQPCRSKMAWRGDLVDFEAMGIRDKCHCELPVRKYPQERIYVLDVLAGAFDSGVSRRSRPCEDRRKVY